MTKIIFHLVIFVFFLTSCTKKECNDYYYLDRVDVYNYPLHDSSNIIISGENPSSIFFLPLDTFNIIRTEQIDDAGYIHSLFLNKPINTNYDYTFYFIDLDTTCYITDIRVKKEKCNDGVFGRSYTHRFDGYYVNNTFFNCQVLKVFPK